MSRSFLQILFGLIMYIFCEEFMDNKPEVLVLHDKEVGFVIFFSTFKLFIARDMGTL